MPITTIKRCQSDPDWWYTIENCPGAWARGERSGGLTITYHDTDNPAGKVVLELGTEDAILIRDAINQFYPPNEKIIPWPSIEKQSSGS
jgi:hypothetical protein